MDAKLSKMFHCSVGMALRLLLSALLVTAMTSAQAADYRLAAPAGWVELISPDDSAQPPAQVSQGVHYLLVDVQSRVDGTGQSSYRHFASRALNGQGVEAIAHVEITVDPAYQRLDLHAVNIRRHGKVIPKLASASIKVLQREKELESLIYDGSKTVNVFVDDVRIGDIVEYAYTLHGANPAFDGRRFGRFELQWQVPVHRFSQRLLWPKARALRIEPVRTTSRPRERDVGDHHEYIWQAEQVAPLVVEADAPAWYDPYPAVQFTEFTDWAAVVRWALPLYDTTAASGALLRREIARIADEATTPSERVLAVLRFVQKDIRYLGVEVGAGSYRPSPPEVVLERRFGDCKDKTLLTLTMLRALGIEADAALVNTRMGRGIDDLLPMPGAFNHVIVLARVDGREYWLDPTRAPQHGRLATLHQPDFERALVVRAETRSLRAMFPVPRLGKRAVRVTIDAREDGGAGDAPTPYTVVTVLEGSEAESTRYRLASENRAELEKRYVNHYARCYPGVTVASPITIDDDVDENRITTTERYLIPAFWKRSDARQRLEAPIEVPDMDEALRYPRTTVRGSPLQLGALVDFVHTTEVRLPRDWVIKPETMEVKDPAFEFRREVVLNEGRTLVLKDHYISLADHVSASDTPRYASHMEQARQQLSYMLFKGSGVQPATGPSSPASMDGLFNWPIAMLATVVTGLWIWLAVKLYLHDPVRPPRAVFSQEPSIGGWLILAALGVILMPFRVGHQIYTSGLKAFALPAWTALTTPGGAYYDAMWAPVLLFEMVATLGMLVMSLLMVIMFFQKRYSFPRLYVAFLMAVLCYAVADAVVVRMVPGMSRLVDGKEVADQTRSLMISVVWILYFWRSQRVKETFVKGRPGTDAEQPTAAPASGMEPI